jgi:iron(II)-dependent oxidoreductase
MIPAKATPKMASRARKLLLIVTGVLIPLNYIGAQDTQFPAQASQIPGPGEGAAARAAWLTDITRWRHERLIRIGYHDEEYKRPELAWAQHNFVAPQVMVEERYLYDPQTGKYTVDRYLDDLEKRYGGIDSVLLWPVYPNIGIDNRSQWDLTRDLPGGVPALREVVRDFHRRNVKVFFPAMPWDVGTRDPGVPYPVATAKLLAEIGADGINGDTFAGLPRTYRTASDEIGHPLVLQPELTPQSDEMLIWNNQSWAYWKFPFEPMISKLKWLEPRHMLDVCDRWARDKTDNLQFAFFNGIGYVSWENIWGIWNGITPRDAEALRRVADVERTFAKLLVSANWEPYYPVSPYGVFGTKFPGEGATLWTIVNRNEYDVRAVQLPVPEAAGTRFYDLWHGRELKPQGTTLSIDIEGHGFGAVLAIPSAAQWPALDGFLNRMREQSEKPLASFSHEWHFLPQQIVDIPATPATSKPAEDMVRIPAGEFEFQVAGIEIEGDNWSGLDVQYPWEDSPRRAHHPRDQAVLYRSLSSNQRSVQTLSRRNSLSAGRRPQFSEGLGPRNLSYRMGEAPGDMGIARRCARLCALGR